MTPDLSFSFFRIDLHVHTRRFSPCAEGLRPDQLYRTLGARGIEGLVITEHDKLWPTKDIAQLNRALPQGRIYRGVEVSSRNGHFIVIGLRRLNGIAAGIDIQSLVGRANAQHAAIIWAHPQMAYGNTPEPSSLETLPQGIHAVEVASSVTRGRQSREAASIARKLGCAQVGGSDAHILSQVGCAYTLFNALPADERELAQAIRSGQCLAGHRLVKTGQEKGHDFIHHT